MTRPPACTDGSEWSDVSNRSKSECFKAPWPVLTGLFSDRREAKDICRQLSSNEQYCAVIRLPEQDG